MYLYVSAFDLRYAYYEGSTWITETVDNVPFTTSATSLGLDAAGRPHISYYAGTDEDLRYAYHNGTTWMTETVDSEGYVGTYNSLALDDLGHPHISYSSSGDLRYAHHDGTAWVIETVDSYGTSGLFNSLALDRDGHPHISYRLHYGLADLRYAYHDGSAWQIETVDSDGDVGWWTALGLDLFGQPHISYLDESNDDLKYAHKQIGIQTPLDPLTGGTLTYTDTQGNPTSIQVPGGAVTETTTLFYVPADSVTPPPGLTFANHAFRLEAYRAGRYLPDLAFQAPVTVTIHYSDFDVGATDDTTLILEYWDDSTWIDATATCLPPSVLDRHPEEHWLAVPICHLSRFALFGHGRHSVYLPLIVRER